MSKINNLKLELIKNQENITDSWGLSADFLMTAKEMIRAQLVLNSGSNSEAAKAVLEDLTDNQIGCMVSFLISIMHRYAMLCKLIDESIEIYMELQK